LKTKITRAISVYTGTTKATHSSAVTLHKAHIMAAYLGQVSGERRTVATTIASLQIPPTHSHEHFRTAFVLRDPTNSSAETASLHNLSINYYGRI
jgi:hypothetical protein